MGLVLSVCRCGFELTSAANEDCPFESRFVRPTVARSLGRSPLLNQASGAPVLGLDQSSPGGGRDDARTCRGHTGRHTGGWAAPWACAPPSRRRYRHRPRSQPRSLRIQSMSICPSNWPGQACNTPSLSQASVPRGTALPRRAGVHAPWLRGGRGTVSRSHCCIAHDSRICRA